MYDRFAVIGISVKPRDVIAVEVDAILQFMQLVIAYDGAVGYDPIPYGLANCKNEFTP